MKLASDDDDYRPHIYMYISGRKKNSLSGGSHNNGELTKGWFRKTPTLLLLSWMHEGMIYFLIGIWIEIDWNCRDERKKGDSNVEIFPNKGFFGNLYSEFFHKMTSIEWNMEMLHRRASWTSNLENFWWLFCVLCPKIRALLYALLFGILENYWMLPQQPYPHPQSPADL